MDGAPAAPTPEEQEKELMEWLEMLKVVDPPKYQALMAELSASAASAGERARMIRPVAFGRVCRRRPRVPSRGGDNMCSHVCL